MQTGGWQGAQRLELDTTEVLTLPSWVFYHDQKPLKGFEIKGGRSAIARFVACPIGTEFRIHQVSTENPGAWANTTVEKIALSAGRSSSCVILQCAPLNPEIAEQFPPSDYHSGLLAYHWRRSFADQPSSRSDLSQPPKVQRAIDDLADAFLPEDIEEWNHSVSSLPLRYVTIDDQAYRLHVAVISQGLKNMNSVLHLLTPTGEIVQTLTDLDHRRVIGLLDFGDGGSQALVVKYGGVAGGIEVLGFPKRSHDPPRLESLLRIGTYTD
jgi:hypothetical protein